MNILPFSLIEIPRSLDRFPLYPHSVGRHMQYRHVRPGGYPVHQIFLIFRGSGLFRDLNSGSETRLEPGMAFCFPPDRGHEYYPLSHEPWHVGFVGLHGSHTRELLEGSGGLPSSPFRPVCFEECWDELGSIWHRVHTLPPSRQDEHAAQELSVSLYRLLLMLRRSDALQGAVSRPQTEAVRNKALQKAVGLIHEHFSEPLLISNLAGAVGYSVQHFQRLFLQEYGVTPHQYLQDLRLQRALQMMTENTAVPIQDIAMSLGMETNYFIRVFRNTYGCTPGAMRTRLQGANGEISQNQ